MNLDVDIARWQKLPPQLRAGQALCIARKLGLGVNRVQSWMAHDAPRQRRPGYKQWSYPRDEVIRALLDMAGVQVTVGALPLASGKQVTTTRVLQDQSKTDPA